jgi:hypothetical protein
MVAVTATYTYVIELDSTDWEALTESEQYDFIERRVPDTSMIVYEDMT